MDLLAEHGGIIRSAQYPQLRNKVNRAVRAGLAVRVFPGVLVDARLVELPAAQVRAAHLWAPQMIVAGAAAAHVSFWPECSVPVLDLVGSKAGRLPSGVRLRQIQIPASLRHDWGPGIITAPAMTLFTMNGEQGDKALCEALRRGAVTLDALEQANELLRGCHGRAHRQEVIRIAKGNPWSIPEMDLHELLWSAGEYNWVGNKAMLLDGRVVIPDVTFEEERVIIEVDGRSTHTLAASFEADRERDNDFEVEDYSVLRFTPRKIWRAPGEVVTKILAVLTRRRRANRPAIDRRIA